MTSKPKYHKNYTEFLESNQQVLSLNLEKIIPKDDSVRLLSHELEELDYTLLYKAYSSKGRNPVVQPKTMFKILVYAYSQNIYSSRKIESACKRDINFMWLLQGQKAPDHTTIARFRTDFLADSCADLFFQMVRRLAQSEELGKATVFIDGTKLEANANKYTFVWRKSVNKWEEKMYSKIQEALRTLNAEYHTVFQINQESLSLDLERVYLFLEKQCKKDHTVFVYGRGHRKSKNQKYLELFRRFLERARNYDWHNASFQGRNNYCKTDPDATFMHMKEDHMRNAQLKPGYNVQIGVDSEYIVCVDVFPDRNDVWTLLPFLKTMEQKTGFRYPSVTADAGYESEEAYTYLKEQGQTAYIKPQTYEKWKKRSFKKDISKRENMRYEKETDTYYCYSEKRLQPAFIRKQKSKSGYQSEVTVYECEDCSHCKVKEKCTRAKKNKKLYVSKKFIKQREESLANIQSEQGILYRVNRSIQVEGAFGVLKNDYGFQRFLLRGKEKVRTELFLLCFGYNLNKLHTKIQKERLRSHLFLQNKEA